MTRIAAWGLMSVAILVNYSAYAGDKIPPEALAWNPPAGTPRPTLSENSANTLRNPCDSVSPTLPCGLEKRDELPPGLAKRDELPPGLAKRLR